MAWRTWALLLTFIMHSVTVKNLKLIHCQNKIPKGGKSKPRGANAPPAPLKETLNGCKKRAPPSKVGSIVQLVTTRTDISCSQVARWEYYHNQSVKRTGKSKE